MQTLRAVFVASFPLPIVLAVVIVRGIIRR